jgi:nucleotide-binding universal stress UspA family protein
MFDKILLPLDGSTLAEQAVPYAIAQAEHFGAEIILLRAVEPLRAAAGATSRAIESVERRLEDLAGEYLEGVAADIRARGIEVSTSVVRGRPHEEIVRFTEENEVDLIVISHHGQSGLSRWLMGTVADHVARGATVPVLLIQTTKEDK